MTSIMINPQAYLAACMLVYVAVGYVSKLALGNAYGAAAGMVGGTLAIGWLENHGHMAKFVSSLAKLIS